MLDLPRSEARHYDSAHGANAAVAGELLKQLKASLGCACGRTPADKLCTTWKWSCNVPLLHASLQSSSLLRPDSILRSHCFILLPSWMAVC